MKIIPANKFKFNEIIKTLNNGGLIVAPTDTVYGLLVDATNNKAVEKLIKLKSRPPGKAISVFVSDFSMMKDYVEIKSNQEVMLNELLPGPFTVILNSKSSQTRSKHKTSILLESEKGTLGIRIPKNKFLSDLVKRFGKPITATSANMSGRSPHYQINSFLNKIPKSKRLLVDLVIDAAKLPHHRPSTVIDLTTPTIKTLRQGDIIPTNVQSYISTSEDQTKKIGQYLLQKYKNEITNKPLVFIIEGELGVGKTVMVKGIVEILGIHNIISPTFVIYYEYKVSTPDIKKFYHFDLYNIQDPEEFKHLGIENLLKLQTLLCFEWGEKTGEIIKELKSKAKIVYIKMKYVNEKERTIKISNT